jgi:DNA-directed RNA polymerase subunit K/omega
MRSKKIRKEPGGGASIYKTVITAAARAIEITEGAEKLVRSAPGESALDVALKEISRGVVSYKTKGNK